MELKPYKHDPQRDGTPKKPTPDARGKAVKDRFDPVRHFDTRKPKKYEWLNGTTL